MNARRNAEDRRLAKLSRLLEPDVVWIFGGTSVRAHASDCQMLNTATNRNGLVAIRSRDEKQSVRDRGFRVVACKCIQPRLALPAP